MRDHRELPEYLQLEVDREICRQRIRRAITGLVYTAFIGLVGGLGALSLAAWARLVGQ